MSVKKKKGGKLIKEKLMTILRVVWNSFQSIIYKDQIMKAKKKKEGLSYVYSFAQGNVDDSTLLFL